MTAAPKKPVTSSAECDGSLPLGNLRQERFCQLVTGVPPLSASGAYIQAGYTKRCVNSLSSRLTANAIVSKRISFLRDENERACHLKKGRALAILAEIAEASIDDFLDDNNHIKVKGHKRSRAVSSVKVRVLRGEGGEEIGKETELRLRDPREQIETIGKICGWFSPDKVEHSGVIQVVEVVQHDDGRG